MKNTIEENIKQWEKEKQEALKEDNIWKAVECEILIERLKTHLKEEK